MQLLGGCLPRPCTPPLQPLPRQLPHELFHAESATLKHLLPAFVLHCHAGGRPHPRRPVAGEAGGQLHQGEVWPAPQRWVCTSHRLHTPAAAPAHCAPLLTVHLCLLHCSPCSPFPTPPQAVTDGVLKVMSKMGISTIASYKGSQVRPGVLLRALCVRAASLCATKRHLLPGGMRTRWR